LITIGLTAAIGVIVVLLFVLRNQQFDFIYQKF
jgi:hypothetical protein